MSNNNTGQKRTAEPLARTFNTAKRRKVDIPTQHGPSGELNIANFVKAREFEIKALETGMRKARKGLMSRAFQQVPRSMRRRTASHNAKKVPRRLRGKALREMKVDNTPTVSKRTRTPSRKLRLRLETAKALKQLTQQRRTARQKKKQAKSNANQTDPENHVAISRVPRLKKNKLADPPKATSKYKRRQVNKTWLPTHLWHTKRAHMTRPTEPLWRMAIPLKPTEKSYRPTHAASGARGCIAWDTSYMSTIGCLGTEHALENMLKHLGFPGEGLTGTRCKRWKNGFRFGQGWICQQDDDQKVIAPATVFWCIPAEPEHEEKTDSAPENPDGETIGEDAHTQKRKQKTKLDRRLMIRIHPSAFHQFWLELVKVAKMQKPQVLVEDLRFEIGSIEVTGPGSTEALLGVLKPYHPITEEDSDENVWTSLAGLTNPSLLPENAMLSFDIVDPRLNHPPRQVTLPKDEHAADELNMLLVGWPPDRSRTPTKLASHKARWTAGRDLPSQKKINRRKALVPPGASLNCTDKDPEIPVLLLACRSPVHDSNLQGSWVVLLPWKCIDPVWRSLQYYPLSSRGTPRFGGLEQMQQIAFENMTPWFPGDMPGTEAGKAWERTESELRFDEWIRRPPSRRLAWNLIDLGLGRLGEIGRGWQCDWDFLLRRDTLPSTTLGPEQIQKISTALAPVKSLTARQRKAEKARAEENERTRRNTSSPESEAEHELSPSTMTQLDKPVDYIQLSPPAAQTLIKKSNSAKLPETPILAPIRIRYLTRGTPKAAARIYRLPTITYPVPNTSCESSPSTSDLQPTISTGINQTSHRPYQQVILSNSLRKKWLAHLSQTQPQSQPQPHLGSTRTNHRGLPRLHQNHQLESLSHINVLPGNAPPEVIAEFGPPPPPTEEQIRQQKREKLMAELMKGDNPRGMWDDDFSDTTTAAEASSADDRETEMKIKKGHTPVPHATDLIGFVTSGGYNLSQGRGTAVGSIWVQKVIEGWREEDVEEEQGQRHVDVGAPDGQLKTDGDAKGRDRAEPSRPAGEDGSGNEERGGADEKKETKKSGGKRSETQKQRERYLCIVRNAGESIGRLASWEVC